MKTRHFVAAIATFALLGASGLAASAYAQPSGGEKLKGRNDNKDKEKGKKKDEGSGPKVGDKAPDWNLKDADGKSVKLSELKGKVVVMDFWATWCGPCKAVMPKIEAIHKDYKDKGVLVYGLNTWEKDDTKANKEGKTLKAIEKAKEYMTSKSYTYGLLAAADTVATQYGVTGIPALYVIGPDGKVLFAETGAGPNTDKDMRAAIEKALPDVKKDDKKEEKKPEAKKPEAPAKPAPKP